jgi:hypothetical protein
MNNTTHLSGRPGNIYPQCPDTVEGMVAWLEERKERRWGGNPPPDLAEEDLLARPYRRPVDEVDGARVDSNERARP